jgi:hypothetical protein
MYSQKPMRIILLLYALIHFVCVFSGRAFAEEGDANHPLVRTIRMASIFDAMAGVNTEDARMALEMLLRNIMTHKSNPFTIRLDFLAEVSESAGKIASEQYDFVILNGMDYLELKPRIALIPSLVISKVDSPTEPLALVTKSNETLETLRKKDSRTLVLEVGRAGEVDKLWLDTVLLEEVGEPSDIFFTSIRRASKASRIVLPVFFGQVEACVVPNGALMVMQELNPQIGSQLQVLRRSEGLVTLLLCATPWAKDGDVEVVVEEAAKAMCDPKAKQALTIVQMNGFYRYKAEHMEATTALYERYKDAMKKQDRQEISH